MSRSSVLIIPSLNPDSRLTAYIKSLIRIGFSRIIVVDDGSAPQYQPIFDAVKSLPECDLLVHTVNMGKGRSLKDAFNYYCQHYSADFAGVITADSDGQHLAEDVGRLDAALGESADALILGCRDFDKANVPWKSSFGNKMTRQVLRLFIGSARQEDARAHAKAITDTQTGLRAIPNQLIKSYLTLSGERFEYETNMLIEALHTHTPIKEISIQTVYINANSETHFRPLADSFAIYSQILSTFFKYTLASLSSFLLDYSIYSLLIVLLGFLPLAPKIWTAAASARIVSSLYNYTMNMSIVFKNSAAHKKTFVKYYTLCISQLICCTLLVWIICCSTGLSEITAKLFVDTLLFIASYAIQKNWVFQEQCPPITQLPQHLCSIEKNGTRRLI